MQPKILLACPTYDGKLYCQSEWLNHISKLTFPGVYCLIVDNSNKPDNYRLLVKRQNEKFSAKRCIPKKKESSQQRVLRSWQMIFYYFIMNDFTHLLILESDIFPPLNCIEYFIEDMDEPICQLPYLHWDGNKTNLMACFMISPGYIDFMAPFQAFMFSTGIRDALQTGIGCTMLQREVVLKCPPRLDKKFPKQFPDVFFHYDWERAGYKARISFDAFCVHKNTKGGWT